MIKLETPFNYQGRTHDVGDIIRLPEELEKKMIEVGTAVQYKEVDIKLDEDETDNQQEEVDGKQTEDGADNQHEEVEESTSKENTKSGRTSKPTKENKDEE